MASPSGAASELKPALSNEIWYFRATSAAMPFFAVYGNRAQMWSICAGVARKSAARLAFAEACSTPGLKPVITKL